MKPTILISDQLLFLRFRQVVKACCLEHDFQMLPNGEETEIGEKGINLSGPFLLLLYANQKCRA